jgi:hypothetical protein
VEGRPEVRVSSLTGRCKGAKLTGGRSWIKNSRTIILAVLPSNVDIATQEILTLAEDYDKAGERTLGVLTNRIW